MMRNPRHRSRESSRRRRRERRQSREELKSNMNNNNNNNNNHNHNSRHHHHSHHHHHSRNMRASDNAVFLDDVYDNENKTNNHDDDKLPPRQHSPSPSCSCSCSSSYSCTHSKPTPFPPSTSQPPLHPDNRPRASSGSQSSSSDSSSSSYLDISRKYPLERFGGLINTFIRAPSERVRRRRRSSGSKRRRRVTYLNAGNSSTSSVDDDMAYGTGFVRKPKARSFSPHGVASASTPEQAEDKPPSRRRAAKKEKKRSKAAADFSDEEILALGRQLSDMARLSTEEELRGSSRSKHSGLVSAAAAFGSLRRHRKQKARHANSKSRRESSSDESDWESASDLEDEDDDSCSFDDESFSSSSDDASSGLAYGGHGSSPPARTDAHLAAAAAAATAAAAAATMATTHTTATTTSEASGSFFGKLFGQSSRKSAVIDPKLFGPVNSLRGVVNTPCGFGEDENAVQNVPMRMRYPLPTTDPNLFDADVGTVVGSQYDSSQRLRPAPVPLQQPVPKAPVSRIVYQTERLESLETRDVGTQCSQSEDNEKRTRSFTAAQSDRRDEWVDPREFRNVYKMDRREDAALLDRREQESDRERGSRGHSPSAYYARFVDDADLKRQRPQVSSQPEVQRTPPVPAQGGTTVSRGERSWMELAPQERRESLKYTSRDEERKQVQSQRVELLTSITEATAVDPFQYQVSDDAFHSPKFAPPRPLTPQVVTVDRVPDFDAVPPRPSDLRLSRRDSFEIRQRAVEMKKAAVESEKERLIEDVKEEKRTLAVAASASVVEERVKERVIEERKEEYVRVAASSTSLAESKREERLIEDRREKHIRVDASSSSSSSSSDEDSHVVKVSTYVVKNKKEGKSHVVLKSTSVVEETEKEEKHGRVAAVSDSAASILIEREQERRSREAAGREEQSRRVTASSVEREESRVAAPSMVEREEESRRELASSMVEREEIFVTAASSLVEREQDERWTRASSPLIAEERSEEQIRVAASSLERDVEERWGREEITEKDIRVTAASMVERDEEIVASSWVEREEEEVVTASRVESDREDNRRVTASSCEREIEDDRRVTAGSSWVERDEEVVKEVVAASSWVEREEVEIVKEEVVKEVVAASSWVERETEDSRRVAASPWVEREEVEIVTASPWVEREKVEIVTASSRDEREKEENRRVTVASSWIERDEEVVAASSSVDRNREDNRRVSTSWVECETEDNRRVAASPWVEREKVEIVTASSTVERDREDDRRVTVATTMVERDEEIVAASSWVEREKEENRRVASASRVESDEVAVASSIEREIEDHRRFTPAPISWAEIQEAKSIDKSPWELREERKKARERERRPRERRRRDLSDESRGFANPPTDAVQMKADEFFRESVMARRAAEETRRLTTESSDISLVDKWEAPPTQESFEFVTPPEMVERTEAEGLYDAPDADVKIDNTMYPHDIHRFRLQIEDGVLRSRSRDLSCERERPLLNLVLPTPTPSPMPSPEEKASVTKAKLTEVRVTATEIEAEAAPSPAPASASQSALVLQEESISESSELARLAAAEVEASLARIEGETRRELLLEAEMETILKSRPVIEVEREAIQETETIDVEFESATETETISEAEAASERERISIIRNEIVVEVETETETETETISEAEAASERERISIIRNEIVVEVELETETETEAEAETILAPERRLDQEISPRPRAIIEVETRSDSDSELESSSETERVAIPGTESVLDLEFETETETTSEVELAPARATVLETILETAESFTPRLEAEIETKAAAGLERRTAAWLPKAESVAEDHSAREIISETTLTTSEFPLPSPPPPPPPGPPPPPQSLRAFITRQKGDVAQPASSTKTVSWGTNTLKSFKDDDSDHSDLATASARLVETSKMAEKPKDHWSQIALAVAARSKFLEGISSSRSDEQSGSSRMAAQDDAITTSSDRVSVEVSRDVSPAAVSRLDGPKPDRMPGGFADDLEFAATLAAGLENTGFDPNIVISDPKFRQRESPPGADDAHGDTWNHSIREAVQHAIDPNSRFSPGRRSPTKSMAGGFEAAAYVENFLEDGDLLRRSRDKDKKKRQERKERLERRKRPTATPGFPTEESYETLSLNTSRESSAHPQIERLRISEPESSQIRDDDLSDEASKKRRLHLRNEDSVISLATTTRFESFDGKDLDKNKSGEIRHGHSPPPERGRERAESSRMLSGGIFSSLWGATRAKIGTETKIETQSEIETHTETDTVNRHPFLDDAGTSGAGAGSSGLVTTVASTLPRPNAAVSSENTPPSLSSSTLVQVLSYVDPEIVPRAIKPAIDPQYGDLLPLPPSAPGSPKQLLGTLPPLPASRPDTPPEERDRKPKRPHRPQDTPKRGHVRSVSNTAIPIELIIANRSNPSSPITSKQPTGSPPAMTPESAPRRPARTLSLSAGKGIMPLMLLDQIRRGAKDKSDKNEELPPLPSSGATSETGSDAPGPSHHRSENISAVPAAEPQDDKRPMGFFNELRLRIGNITSIPRTDSDVGLGDVTPKAEAKPEFPIATVLDNDGMRAPSAQISTSLVESCELTSTESMPGNRSSFSLDSITSSDKLSKMLDSENRSQSPPTSTQSQAPEGAARISAQSLTPATEQFSDAAEGQTTPEGFDLDASATISLAADGDELNRSPMRLDAAGDLKEGNRFEHEMVSIDQARETSAEASHVLLDETYKIAPEPVILSLQVQTQEIKSLPQDDVLDISTREARPEPAMVEILEDEVTADRTDDVQSFEVIDAAGEVSQEEHRVELVAEPFSVKGKNKKRRKKKAKGKAGGALEVVVPEVVVPEVVVPEVVVPEVVVPVDVSQPGNDVPTLEPVEVEMVKEHSALSVSEYLQVSEHDETVSEAASEEHPLPEPQHEESVEPMSVQYLDPIPEMPDLEAAEAAPETLCGGSLQLTEEVTVRSEVEVTLVAESEQIVREREGASSTSDVVVVTDEASVSLAAESGVERFVEVVLTESELVLQSATEQPPVFEAQLSQVVSETVESSAVSEFVEEHTTEHLVSDTQVVSEIMESSAGELTIQPAAEYSLVPGHQVVSELTESSVEMAEAGSHFRTEDETQIFDSTLDIAEAISEAVVELVDEALPSFKVEAVSASEGESTALEAMTEAILESTPEPTTDTADAADQEVESLAEHFPEAATLASRFSTFVARRFGSKSALRGPEAEPVVQQILGPVEVMSEPDDEAVVEVTTEVVEVVSELPRDGSSMGADMTDTQEIRDSDAAATHEATLFVETDKLSIEMDREDLTARHISSSTSQLVGPLADLPVTVVSNVGDELLQNAPQLKPTYLHEGLNEFEDHVDRMDFETPAEMPSGGQSSFTYDVREASTEVQQESVEAAHLEMPALDREEQVDARHEENKDHVIQLDQSGASLVIEGSLNVLSIREVTSQQEEQTDEPVDSSALEARDSVKEKELRFEGRDEMSIVAQDRKEGSVLEEDLEHGFDRRSLESHISEPLFSQNLEPSQDGFASLETTQNEDGLEIGASLVLSVVDSSHMGVEDTEFVTKGSAMVADGEASLSHPGGEPAPLESFDKTPSIIIESVQSADFETCKVMEKSSVSSDSIAVVERLTEQPKHEERHEIQVAERLAVVDTVASNLSVLESVQAGGDLPYLARNGMKISVEDKASSDLDEAFSHTRTKTERGDFRISVSDEDAPSTSAKRFKIDKGTMRKTRRQRQAALERAFKSTTALEQAAHIVFNPVSLEASEIEDQTTQENDRKIAESQASEVTADAAVAFADNKEFDATVPESRFVSGQEKEWHPQDEARSRFVEERSSEDAQELKEAVLVTAAADELPGASAKDEEAFDEPENYARELSVYTQGEVAREAQVEGGWNLFELMRRGAGRKERPEVTVSETAESSKEIEVLETVKTADLEESSADAVPTHDTSEEGLAKMEESVRIANDIRLSEVTVQESAIIEDVSVIEVSSSVVLAKETVSEGLQPLEGDSSAERTHEMKQVHESSFAQEQLVIASVGTPQTDDFVPSTEDTAAGLEGQLESQEQLLVEASATAEGLAGSDDVMDSAIDAQATRADPHKSHGKSKRRDIAGMGLVVEEVEDSDVVLSHKEKRRRRKHQLQALHQHQLRHQEGWATPEEEKRALEPTDSSLDGESPGVEIHLEAVSAEAVQPESEIRDSISGQVQSVGESASGEISRGEHETDEYEARAEVVLTETVEEVQESRISFHKDGGFSGEQAERETSRQEFDATTDAPSDDLERVREVDEVIQIVDISVQRDEEECLDAPHDHSEASEISTVIDEAARVTEIGAIARTENILAIKEEGEISAAENDVDVPPVETLESSFKVVAENSVEMLEVREAPQQKALPDSVEPDVAFSSEVIESQSLTLESADDNVHLEGLVNPDLSRASKGETKNAKGHALIQEEHETVRAEDFKAWKLKDTQEIRVVVSNETQLESQHQEVSNASEAEELLADADEQAIVNEGDRPMPIHGHSLSLVMEEGLKADFEEDLVQERTHEMLVQEWDSDKKGVHLARSDGGAKGVIIEDENAPGEIDRDKSWGYPLGRAEERFAQPAQEESFTTEVMTTLEGRAEGAPMTEMAIGDDALEEGEVEVVKTESVVEESWSSSVELMQGAARREVVNQDSMEELRIGAFPETPGISTGAGFAFEEENGATILEAESGSQSVGEGERPVDKEAGTATTPGTANTITSFFTNTWSNWGRVKNNSPQVDEDKKQFKVGENLKTPALGESFDANDAEMTHVDSSVRKMIDGGSLSGVVDDVVLKGETGSRKTDEWKVEGLDKREEKREEEKEEKKGGEEKQSIGGETATQMKLYSGRLERFGLLQGKSEVEEVAMAAGETLQEAPLSRMYTPFSDARSDVSVLSDYNDDYRRSPSGGFLDPLPSVMEVPEEAPGEVSEEIIEATFAGINRGGGYDEIPSLRNLRRPRSKTFAGAEQAGDSGSDVYTSSDVAELMEQLKTPEPDLARRRLTRRSTIGNASRLAAGRSLLQEATTTAAMATTTTTTTTGGPDAERNSSKARGSADRVLTGTGTKAVETSGRASPKKHYGPLSMGAAGLRTGVSSIAASGMFGPTVSRARPRQRPRGTDSPPLSSPLSSSPVGPDGRSRSGSRPPQPQPAQPLAPQLSQAVEMLAEGHGVTSRAEGKVRRLASNSSLTSLRRTPSPLPLDSLLEEHAESPPVRSSTQSLRRMDRRVGGSVGAGAGEHRPAAQEQQQQQQAKASSPVANEGRVRAKDVTDVYDGYGEGRIGSPKSPTRPPSMRRRQSMQVLELEARIEQLIAENRILSDARVNAEHHLGHRAATALSERDAQIESLKQSLLYLQNEVSRLSEVNDGLASANAELARQDTSRYIDLQVNNKGQDTLRQSLIAKDAQIAELQAKLNAAEDKIRELQREILASKTADTHFLVLHNEDYFDHRCQQLCSHVQQWVLRFSKFSDMRASRLTSELNDEKLIDRLDNAILDGTDVDRYLNDRVRRRDVFLSMTMTMIWEFVFTRYLFGMDREHRQKLKSLEKLLTEVGPPQAVRQWRAVTLTLLSRRDAFQRQRQQDTEAVVQAIYQTLCKILPPPSNLEAQIQSQLRRVMHEAVQLSIEMRLQKAEYMMLPPLQPEYDADGELVATVHFNASMMHERSGTVGMSGQELESQGAIVRVVLFPLVVKRGDDDGVNDDEIVVCPAQVLVARSKLNRLPTPSSDGDKGVSPQPAKYGGF